MVSFTKEKQSWDMDTTDKIETSKKIKNKENMCLRLESTNELQRNMIRMQNILSMIIPSVPRRKINQMD